MGLNIILAAVASMVVGSVWYGPLFGEKWMKLMGFSAKDKKDMQKEAKKGYSMMFVGSLVMAYVLNEFVGGSATQAMGTAFWIWLGFIAPLNLGDVSWGGKPMELFYLNAAYWLVTLCVMAAVVVSF